MRRISSLALDLDVVREARERIEAAGCPKLAARVSVQPVLQSGEEATFPVDWRDAWNWARIRTHLDETKIIPSGTTESAAMVPSVKLTSNAALVREQLNRLLAHPLFTNSKRYPVLLAYTVEQALLGNAGELKERTIGVEAWLPCPFGLRSRRVYRPEDPQNGELGW
jgi:hypothetical protein